MHSVFEIAKHIKASWVQQHADTNIEHILIDSRKLIFPASSLFFAMGGPRRNGMLFIEELYSKGVRNFVVQETLEHPEIKYPAANILQVKDVLQSLHLLTAWHRSLFTIPVIGITGSNGKTIVKEWLYQLLQSDYTIVRSPKSYNSQIGVPLSIWQINNQHTLGIFEAGISQPDEMHRLEKMIAPAIGIFTNIGDAHSEGFLNIRQKINEKLQLFSDSEVLIYGADNLELNETIINFAYKIKDKTSLQLFTWGSKITHDLQIVSIEKKSGSTVITANESKKNISANPLILSIPFTDDASIENAITCCCVLLYLKTDRAVIATRMRQLRAVAMRLELKKGSNQCSIINDSYSADINSLNIALDFLSQQQQHPNRTLILSDILQSGKSSRELYTTIAALLQQKKVNRLIGIGPEISKEKLAFKDIAQTVFFESVADLKHHFHNLVFFNESILLKGARVFEFEQVSNLLEEKAHQTVLEINLSAITHNLKKYQQLLKPSVKLMAMVKAFSYGSGSFEIANLLQFHKVDYLAVAFADEGVALRKAGISLPIMVLSPEEATFGAMLQYNLEPELYSFAILQSFHQYLTGAGIEQYPVHIKLDTGMHRLGFELNDMKPLKIALQSFTRFKIQSILSHLVGSDNALLNTFTQTQAGIFNECCTLLQQVIDYPFIKHLSNTSAIMGHSNLQYDMVRLGIGLYGVDGNSNMQAQLQNVTTLKTSVAQIRIVKAGESVGYNRSGIVTKDTKVATVRIGYADGYPRILSNGNGKMWVQGKLLPVIGNICMDMTMVDVTGIDIEEGDAVTVFGKDLPVQDVAKWAQTITYEILAGISQRVKRIYFEE